MEADLEEGAVLRRGGGACRRGDRGAVLRLVQQDEGGLWSILVSLRSFRNPKDVCSVKVAVRLMILCST